MSERVEREERVEVYTRTARAALSRLAERAATMIDSLVATKTANDWAEAFEKPASRAPLWAHTMVAANGAGYRAAGAERGDAGPQQQFNVVLVDRAPSTEAWMESVKHRKKIAGGGK